MRWIAALVLASTLAAQERGKLVENIATRADASQTYTLYLPTSYTLEKKLPLLLVFDPRGRGTAAAEIFKAAAEEHQWILISANGTRSDDGGVANEKAVPALLPELSRWAHDPKRVYATGFSGTAILACALGMNTGLFAGVIGVGGRVVPQYPPAQFNFAHYGFAGETDFNNREMRQLDALMTKPHRFEEFPGDHRWITPELARDAIVWMEVIAMQEGRRPKDDAFIARAHADDLAKANALGSTLEGLRRHRAILRTYGGDAAIVAKLERELQKDIAEEAKWDEFEERFRKDVFGNLREAIAQKFRVPELQRRAKKGGLEGKAARRLLAQVYGETSRYVTRQLFDRREYALAAEVLTVATEIHPDRWPAWYNLGAAYARAGERKRALDALEQAFVHGFRDTKMLAADEDYASLRADKRYLALLASRSQ